ncbi:MAG: PAS domain S-box protein [Candidatus Hydrogenedentes bacterium]|nr:PAS domain S-box protein [Candidatus Hydrogenedentota bacterium]
MIGDPAEFQAITQSLARAGHNAECRHVTDPGQLAALTSEPWDALVCGLHQERGGVESCRATVRRHFPDLPIILLAGDLPAEKAVEYLKLGIADFVRRDDLARLGPCVERAIEEARAREAHQQAEARLLESRQFAQAALDALSPRIAVLDAHGGVQAVNRAWREFEEQYGPDPAAALEGGNYLNAPESCHPECAALLREVIAGREAESTYEYQGHCGGEPRWYRCRMARFGGDGPDRIVVTHLDITPQKEAEEELRRREEQLLQQRNALIALTSAASISRDDLHYALRQVTETAAHTLGVARASIWRLVADRSGIECLDLYDQVLATHESGATLAASDYPAYFRALGGFGLIAASDAARDPRTREFARDYFPATGITSMLDAPVHFGGLLHGVLCCEHVGPIRQWTSNEKTFVIALGNLVSLALEEWERRQAEERLRLQSAAMIAASNGVLITERDGLITWVNPAFTAMSGYSLEEAIGKHPQDLLDSGCHETAFFQELWSTILAGQVWSGTILNRRKDGSLYSESQTISPIRDEHGAITHFVAIKEDVTEKLAAEQRLHEAQDRLQRAVRAGKIVLWECDMREGAVSYSAEWLVPANAEPDPDTLTVQYWLDQVHPEDAGPLREDLETCANNPGARFQRELRLRKGNGEYRWILMAASSDPAATETPARIIGTNIDVSDRKRLESEYQQAQKMESVGRLAGGVAHDFNNLLGVIGGYSEFALQTLEEDDPLRDEVIQIKNAADRAADLTRQLLAFSRRQIMRSEVTDINGIVSDLEKMLQRVIGEDIELDVNLAPELGSVMADRGQIEQVLMNLSINARDAMPRGGRLAIATTNQTLGESDAQQRPGADPGDYVCLTVRDNGVGMDQRTLDRIFEPFFTTKEQGKGTGLGLATVYGIVKQSGGGIWVTSAPGQGAEFQIYLPRIDAPATEERAPATAPHITRGSETILLAEDEEALRAVTHMILTHAGYTVLAAESGSRAIELMRENTGQVDLLLTDVVMPGLSGPQLVTELKAIAPDLKVLFMSGYADDTVIRHGILAEGVEFIHKPYSFAQLTKKIREVLDKP